MNSNTKIVVIRMKELIVGGIAVIAAIILIAVIISANACSSDSNGTNTQSAKTTSINTSSNTADNASNTAASVNSNNAAAANSANVNTYIPGVYTASITLNGEPVDIQVTVDKNNINSIELKNLSESVTTMYPMIQNSFNELANAVISSGSADNISYDANNKYTASILLNAIKSALSKCTVQ